MKIPVADLKQFAVEALCAVNMSPSDAQIAAEALVTADAMGVFTHGTKLLIGYLKKLQGGGYRATAAPRIEREGPGWAVVDGESALGQVGCVFAMRLAMQKAQKSESRMSGCETRGTLAAGYYATLAARGGCIGMVTGNDKPSVAAPGSRGAVLGSNPIAYGVPVAGGDPILLDIATAAVAGGKVYAAHTRGEPIPPTWLIDAEGRPTTDGSLYPARASLAPMAGHKGYGFGLWCEILSGALPGGKLTWQVGSWMFDEPSLPSLHNASFIAIDVGVIAPREQFDRNLKSLIDELHAAPAAEGCDRVLLPGEREWNSYRLAQTAGIDLPMDVVEKLQLCASLTGVSPAWLPAANA